MNLPGRHPECVHLGIDAVYEVGDIAVGLARAQELVAARPGRKGDVRARRADGRLERNAFGADYAQEVEHLCALVDRIWRNPHGDVGFSRANQRDLARGRIHGGYLAIGTRIRDGARSGITRRRLSVVTVAEPALVPADTTFEGDGLRLQDHGWRGWRCGGLL